MDLADKRGLVLLHVSIVLLVLGQAGSVTTPSIQQCETETVVCEHRSTALDCGVDIINICTAVYGRTDNTTCPHREVSDTSCGVDVLAVLDPLCNGQKQCTFRVSNKRFAGDPCVGTYKYLEVAYTCKDVDECTTGANNCDINATCTNTRGSFFCACNVGYTGNGSSCTDVDECTTRTDTCNINAACINTRGSFKCSCNGGYVGDGFSCTVNPGYTVTTIETQPASGDLGAVVPTVVVLIVAILIAIIVAAIWYRRRKFSSTKDREPHVHTSTTILNPCLEIETLGDQNAAVTNGSSEDAQQDEYTMYTELPTSVSLTEKDNMDIYNEVGEENYNVLFGGKEQGDYHEYNLPDNEQETSSRGHYQDLLREGTFQEITTGYHSKETAYAGLKHEPADKKTVVRGYQEATVDNHAYQDLRKEDDSYTPLHLDSRLPTNPPTQEHVLSNEDSYQAVEPEYLELEANDSSLTPWPVDDNDYQTLQTSDPAYVVFESDQEGPSLKVQASTDNTYQQIIKNSTPD